MSCKYNKYVSYITAIAILVLILFFTNKVSEEVFFILFASLSIAMLILGFLAFRNALKDKEKIDLHASDIKRKLKK
ncbi:hypothetical protein ACQKNX_04465 [Lysinibacillus sp. NPDC093712]|uniref:hypothetical protein n=1 Tax=Lysinibacillus sp. NPDC093712 TaxID=3390579 RepID=UPI003D026D51